VLLFLHLEKDHDSIKASFYLENNPENLLEALQYCLSGEDDSQRTARFRALLEFSGGRVDCLQHESVPNYTSSENVRDYASFLGIARTRSFGDVDYEDMCKWLAKSPVFSRMMIGVQDLKEWSTRMIYLTHSSYILTVGVSTLRQSQTLYRQLSAIRSPVFQ